MHYVFCTKTPLSIHLGNGVHYWKQLIESVETLHAKIQV